MKSKLFKKLDQVPAKENLIDDAVEANANANSDDPAARIAAVDFDAEIKELMSKAGINPEGGEVPPEGEPLPEEAPPAEGEPPATADPAGAEEVPPAEGEGEPEEDIGELDASDFVGVPPDATKAVECINRLVRCIEALDEQHDTAVVTPELAGIVNNEVNSVARQLDLEMPLAFATENETPDSLYSSTKGRAKDILKKAMEFLKQVWEKAKRWTLEFVANYKARRGIYPKTASGFMRRATAIKDFPEDVEATLSLGALSHNANTNTFEGIIGAVGTNFRIASGICEGQTRRNPKAAIALGTLVQGSNMPQLEFLSIPSMYKLTTSSNSIVTDASVGHKFSMPDGDTPGMFEITNAPGDKSYSWTFSLIPPNSLSDFETLIKRLSQFRFTVGSSQNANTELTLKVTLKEIAALAKTLTAADSVYSVIDKSFDNLRQSETAMQRIIAAGIDMLAKDEKNVDSTFAQDFARTAALWTSAYERVTTVPMSEATRIVDRTQAELVRLMGGMVAAVEEKLPQENKAA